MLPWMENIFHVRKYTFGSNPMAGMQSGYCMSGSRYFDLRVQGNSCGFLPAKCSPSPCSTYFGKPPPTLRNKPFREQEWETGGKETLLQNGPSPSVLEFEIMTFKRIQKSQCSSPNSAPDPHFSKKHSFLHLPPESLASLLGHSRGYVFMLRT